MKELILSTGNGDNTILHIARNPDGTMQDIVNVRLPFGNMELLQALLQTDRLGGKCHDIDEETGYFFMYDNNREWPYPSVMIWKYKRAPKETDPSAAGLASLPSGFKPSGIVRYICDMEKEDLSIIPYAARTYLGI